MFFSQPLSKLIEDKKELFFIHVPKCGGTYINSVLSHLKIKNNDNNKFIPNKYITFTVIRNPVDRFESLLNYRLNENKARSDWPQHLTYAYQNKNVKLDEIVSKMSNKDIFKFKPFSTLNYYAKDVDIIITIENLPKLLEHFGYTYDINSFKPLNVSKKTRGKLNLQNQSRLKALFYKDMILFNKVINSSF